MPENKTSKGLREGPPNSECVHVPSGGAPWLPLCGLNKKNIGNGRKNIEEKHEHDKDDGEEEQEEEKQDAEEGQNIRKATERRINTAFLFFLLVQLFLFSFFFV